MKALRILEPAGMSRLRNRIPTSCGSVAGPSSPSSRSVLVWFGVLNVDYQRWLTAKGDEAERFTASLQRAYPALPENGRLIVTEHPRSLSLTPNDGMMLGAAVRIAYDRDVEVLTPWHLRRADIPPPTERDVWYPP